MRKITPRVARHPQRLCSLPHIAQKTPKQQIYEQDFRRTVASQASQHSTDQPFETT